MTPSFRPLQVLGIALVVGSAFAPAYHFRAHPGGSAPPPHAAAAPVGFHRAGTRHVPAVQIAQALAAPPEGTSRGQALWEARPWYPYVLVLPWALALLLVAAGGARRRGVVAALLGALALLVAAFEACYLRTDYLSFFPGALGVAEVTLAWLLVVGILFWRRRRDRRPGAVEAALGAQALLCVVHLVTLPATMVRPWVQVHGAGAILAATLANFPIGFWVGLLGFSLVALPVYASRD